MTHESTVVVGTGGGDSGVSSVDRSSIGLDWSGVRGVGRSSISLSVGLDRGGIMLGISLNRGSVMLGIGLDWSSIMGMDWGSSVSVHWGSSIGLDGSRVSVNSRGNSRASLNHNWGLLVDRGDWHGSNWRGSSEDSGRSGKGLGDNSVETVQVIGGVIHSANGTVGLHQRVLSFHGISITNLMRRLDISGQTVVDSVLEGVLRVRLYVGVEKYEKRKSS